MHISLGIDTGGTYTDAVLVDHDTGAVLASAKSLTTRHDLALGIGGAIRAVFAAPNTTGATITPAQITLVALSTTLATNTLAEGQRGAVCLLLVGYDHAQMAKWGFDRQLAADDVVHLAGGHDERGNEAAALDEAAARAAILARKDTVEAFAISSYFGVRNPSHELRVRGLVEELTGLPVTCGHELTSKLNAMRRATTVALNAHLILPLRELIASVRRTLDAWAITAPLMVVKGDGSLVRAEWAMQRPIETILSGPAASAVGAWHLAGRRDVWAIDVGGTTTDIARLHDGAPILNPEGAYVGGWQTMVEAVDVHTTGLGGDSYVRLDEERRLVIGPRRVVPLSLLAREWAGVTAELRREAAIPPAKRPPGAGEFVIAGRPAGARLAPPEEETLRSLAEGPLALASLAEQRRAGALARRQIEALEGRGLVRRAAFTPTDALHVLGRYQEWDAEAARLAAELLAGQLGVSVTAFCEQVVTGVAHMAATEVVRKALEEELGRTAWHQTPSTAAFLRLALDGDAPSADENEIGCAITLRRPLVAIGAPVAAYMPEAARRLHTELVIPPHAEVANAVGAVSGSVVVRQRVLINPLADEEVLRVHLPDGPRDFEKLEDAVAHVLETVPAFLEAQARAAGAEQVEVRSARQDHWAPTRGGGLDVIYLGTELTFSAAGRPRVAR
jgi:N-methylhydantoinase A/oxoprolinase/acetone carboxylase beta subunit